MKRIFSLLMLAVSLTITAQQKSDTIHNDKPLEMEEVIVSSAFKKLQSETVMKVERMNIKKLQQNGASSLIDGLTSIAGVSQISTGISIGKPVIRGLSSNRVLVYSQGTRMENQQFGEEHGLGLNDSGVESVEIIKGPASLLYGSDAIGGVIYFNPEKFASDNSIETNFSQSFLTNTLGTKSNLGVKYSKTNWKFLVRGASDSNSDYKIPTNESVTNTRFNEKDFKTAIGYNFKKVSTILRYNYNLLDIGIPEFGIGEQTNTKTTDYPKQGIASNIVSLNNIINFEKSKLDLNIGYISNDRKEFAIANETDLHLKLKTLNYDLKYYLPKYNNFETILGVQGMNQTNNNFGIEFLIPDAKVNYFGVFGTIQYQSKSNIFQLGLRFDNRNISTNANGILGEAGSFEAIEKSFTSFNSSLGYKTNLDKNIILRLNVASGFRSPNLSELSSNGVHEGSNRYEIGNKDLKNEQNFQTDLNIEYKNSHFEFFVNGFNNQINNYIFIAPTGTIDIEGNDIYVYSQQNATLYGGEIGLHFHPHPLDWLHFDSSFETVTGKQNNGDNLPLIPANKWNNTIKTDFNPTKWLESGFVAMNINHFFNQNNISAFETETQDYTIVNFAISGKIKFGKTIFETTLNANNLFDKSYISHLSRLKSDNIPNIGRNIILGINFNF